MQHLHLQFEWNYFGFNETFLAFFFTLCGEGRFFVFNEGIPTVPGDDDALCSSFMKENVG